MKALTGKKILSLLLSVLMCLSLMPLSAFAAGGTSNVAEIGNTKYATLGEAIAAAKDGDTVTLLANIKDTGKIILPANVTFDGAGKTLSGNSSISVNKAGGTVKNTVFKDIHDDTVVSDANKKKYGFSDDKVGTLSAVYAPLISGKLVIEGCTFENIDWDALQITPAEGADITIINNTFKVSVSETVKEQLRHIHVEMAYGTGFDYEGTDIKLTVTDNKMFGETKNACMGIWWVGKNSTLELTGNYYDNPETASITLSDKTFNRENRNDLIYPARSNADVDVDDLTTTALVIKDAFNSTSHNSLAEAVAAAKDGETVKLVDDVSLTERLVIDTAITLNLNNKTITSSYSIDESKSGAERYAIVNNNAVAFENGTIVAEFARAIGAYGDVTLNGIKVNGMRNAAHANVAFCKASAGTCKIINSTITGSYAFSNFANNATIEIENSTLEGTGNVLYHNGSNYGLKLTVNKTTIKATGNGCGVYISGSVKAYEKEGAQKATFTDCTINSETSGVEVKYTDLTLDNCNVSVTAENANYSQNNNGPTTAGFAVVSTDNATSTATPAPKGSIVITGENGKYTGLVGLGSFADVKETYSGFTDTTYAISGGTFSSAVLPEYCADGFIPAQNADGTYGVTPKATTEKRTLTVDIGSGDGVKYSIAGGESGKWQETQLNAPFDIGTKFTVTAIEREGYKFLYWTNDEDRILTTSKTYSFYLGENKTIKACYYSATVESNYYVVFNDKGDKIQKAARTNDAGKIIAPSNGVYAGWKFVGWFDAPTGGTKYDVDANGYVTVTSDIVLYAHYELASAEKYTVTVDSTEVGQYNFRELVTVKTDLEKEGKKFVGWYVGDTLVSYDAEYSFYITGNIDLIAKYDESAVENQPVVSLIVSDIVRPESGNAYSVLTLDWTVPEGYTFAGAGIILTKNAEQKNNLKLENVGSNGIIKTSTKITNAEGTYIYTLQLTAETLASGAYAVGYLTFIKDGKTITVYSPIDPILIKG